MIPPHTLFRFGGVPEEARARIVAGLEARIPEALWPLVEIAAQFHDAGGRWSASEWAALTPVEQQACATAGRESRARDARRLAVLVGLALKTPGQLEAMAAEFDGGEMQEHAETEALLDEIEGVSGQMPRRGA